MPLPDRVLRFWRALDAHFGSVLPTTWGAVVTDGRFPAIWDANYARVDVASDAVTHGDVASARWAASPRRGGPWSRPDDRRPREWTPERGAVDAVNAP
ncbi:MAG: hypothetical protein U0V56_00825 [Actinomycetota bacterium]